MARQTYTTENKERYFSLVQIRPLLISVSVTMISLSVLALGITFGPVSESTANICIHIITSFSIFLAGLLSARHRTSKGYLTGCVSGISYVLVSYCMSALAFGAFSPGKAFLRMIVSGILWGALGGIIGVNTKRKKYIK